MRVRKSQPTEPATTLDTIRQAEKILPGLRERLQGEGLTEEQAADLIDRRVADGELRPLSSRRAVYLPSQHLLGSAVLLAVGALLGYLGIFKGAHARNALVRPGLWGAAYFAGVMLAVLAISEVAARVRRR